MGHKSTEWKELSQEMKDEIARGRAHNAAVTQKILVGYSAIGGGFLALSWAAPAVADFLENPAVQHAASHIGTVFQCAVNGAANCM